jgi:hypothetical protein
MVATEASMDSKELKKIMLKSFEETRRENSMRITYSVDNGFKNAKLFVGLGFGFTLITVTIWATWNVKNILKIDIFPGGHHGMIDDINAGVGM